VEKNELANASKFHTTQKTKPWASENLKNTVLLAEVRAGRISAQAGPQTMNNGQRYGERHAEDRSCGVNMHSAREQNM
jgi:hypothetical protein